MKYAGFRFTRAIRRICGMPGNICREIKFAIQRVRRGYSSRDVWNMDSWFLKIIPPMLRELQKSNEGYPAFLEPEYYLLNPEKYPVPLNVLSNYMADEGDTETMKLIKDFHKDCFEYWKGILIEMAELLEACRSAEEEYADFREREAVRKEKLERFFELFSKYFDGLWA